MAKIRAPHYREQTCCGTIQDVKYNTRAARGNKPQPWITLKLTVGISIAIIGYSSYVYVGKFCVPMIQRQGNALGGRAMGVAFLIVFSILALMLLWTYTKVVVVSPGFARDYIPNSTAPSFGVPLPPNDTFGSNEIPGPVYENTPVPIPPQSHPLSHSEDVRNGHLPVQSSAVSEKPPPASPIQRSDPQIANGNTGVLDALSPIRVAHFMNNEPHHFPIGDPDSPEFRSLRDTRLPSTIPVLLPEHRYCPRDGIVKPYRTHHCRACGTCVLKYDHHCPWIGQCVGARNHKFFVNFLEWVSLFALWIFTSLLGLNVKSGGDIDPQEIVVIAISGLFSLFTVMLLISQVRMVGLNQTSVEGLQQQSMKERERATLSRLHPFHHFRAKAQTKRKWDQEWGKIDTEGNIWWLGSFRANWEAVMGQNIWWWFFPIGRSAGDGLQYPVNPRFDEQGRWRRRKEWPVDLR